jgi:hypothetical protein
MVSPVEEMVLMNQAISLDHAHKMKNNEHVNVVEGCVRSAKIAESVARWLINAATITVDDDGDLVTPKENLDVILNEIERLKLFVTKARNREPSEIPLPDDDFEIESLPEEKLAEYRKYYKTIEE